MFSTTDTFMNIVRDLPPGAKYYYQILDVAENIKKYLHAGKDPAEALDFLLGFYQAVPDAQEVIRNVITEALQKRNNAL